jgi:hypothetical protein
MAGSIPEQWQKAVFVEEHAVSITPALCRIFAIITMRTFREVAGAIFMDSN